ncbi:hypothetical protein Acsp04_09140 [Actinomadura sp. NBRC 104425]|nr:hypothetical protein Acsp04_09140 [Actinomadura sp. NBRC 104425]
MRGTKPLGGGQCRVVGDVSVGALVTAFGEGEPERQAEAADLRSAQDGGQVHAGGERQGMRSQGPQMKSLASVGEFSTGSIAPPGGRGGRSEIPWTVTAMPRM